VPDRSSEYRLLAAECLAISRIVCDPATRASLLLMAQTWLDLAIGEASLDVLVQQQRQVQPKKQE